MTEEISPRIQVKLLTSPLVAWISLFKSEGDDSKGDLSGDATVSYRELYQGNFLRNVIKQIYNRNVDDNIVTRGARLDEAMERLTNWNIIMKSIKIFYRDELQQVVTMKLPDILRICRDPEDESSYADIRTTILLILGCAIQCERKEFFIQQILQKLNSEQQHAIKDCITELKDRTLEFTNTGSSEHITDSENTEHVISLETQVESLGITGKALYYHLNRVLEERDLYIEEAARATVDSELYLAELDELRAQNVASPTSPEKHHIVVELAEEKAKVRRLRMEVEERSDQTEDLKAECTELKGIVSKLQAENKSLTQDARSARSYRDELDIVKEKALKVDKLERQLQSFKDKMHELDFYKARVDELREDNKILIETKVMLEDQLATSQQRVETIIELENELMNRRKEAEEWNIQRELDLKTIQDMHECITKLQCEKNSTLNESANLEEELALARGLANSELSQSLKDQLADTATTEVLRLELENQRLQKLLSEQRDQFALENSSHLLELEKENSRLASKVQKLQESTTRSSQDFIELENEKQEYHRQVTELKNTMETVKESSERQVKELERENEQLNLTIETLRQRNEQNIDMRVKEVERENKRMAETVKEVNQQLSKLDYEHRTLQKAHSRLQEQVEKVEQVEEQSEKLERENSDLVKQIATLKLTVEKYEEVEQQLSDKEVENRKLHKQVENMREKLERGQQQSQDNIALTVENQRLTKAIANSQKDLSRLAELEAELEEKEKELSTSKSTLHQYEADRAKLQELEIKQYNADSEIHKLNKSIELYTKKLEAKTADYEELQKENKGLEATIQSLRLTIRNLERLTEDNKSLEDSNSLLSQEKESKEKEIKKLKQTLELKESIIDEYNEKLAALERESKSLRRSGEKWRQASMRVREHEKEANDLMQTTIMDKKTISTLREELVQEKIKSQQISNELEQLRSDLHRMGLNKDKLEADVSAADEHRLKALQAMMEDAHKESLSIKDKKIETLEQNLEETKNLNATLHRQLDTMQKEYQSYLDRKQNEPSTNTTTINVQPSPGKQSSSISQLVIKKTPQQGPVQQIQSEHYLAVQHELMKGQRQLATLKSENAGLKSHSMYSEERAKKLETQLAAVKGEKNSLHAQNAQLQVENTTLQSQSNSLLKQNSRLQQQLAKLQSDFEETAISHQELNETYESLVADHEQLQLLNEQLSTEYEALISEHGMLKSQYKQLKEEMLELDRSKNNLAREKAAIEEMRQSIHKERLSIQLDDSFSFNQDMKRLSEEKQLVQQQADKMRGEYRDLLSEYKNVKTEYNQLKLKHTELKGDMADCRDQLNKLDIQNAKLTNKCEALERLNTKLEEENKQLIFQLQALLQQNQDLLSQTLESSEHFREEENSYRDQLANMRRAKEKLEEKIMDHYKSYEKSGGKKKGIGSVLVKKAKGFITKRSREAGRRQTIAGINYMDGTSESDSHSATTDKSCNQCSSCRKVPQEDSDGEPSANHFRPVSATDSMRNSESKLISRKDLSRSQLDLVYGSESVDDSRSLSGVSIGSKGSSRGSEDTATGPSDITLSKSNKVRLRKSRVKAQSIENLFDTESPRAAQKDEPVSAFQPLRNKRLSAADIRPDSNRNTLYNSTVNQHLSADHRKIAVSTTALNMPNHKGRLREVSLTIPIDELTKAKGARSSDDLLSPQNESSTSSPLSSNRSDRMDNSYKSNRSDQKNGGHSSHHLPLSQRSSAGERRRQMWLYDYAPDSDDDGRSLSNRSSDDQYPTKDCDDNLPTKDVGLRSDSLKSSGSSNSLFYTPPSSTRRVNSSNNMAVAVPTEERLNVSEQYGEAADHPSSSRSRAEFTQRAARGDYSMASPKPDLVMGTEGSPRGLVYYDNPQPNRSLPPVPGHKSSNPKYGGHHEYPPHLPTSRSHPSNMYASLDSRLDRSAMDRHDGYRRRGPAPPPPIPKSASNTGGLYSARYVNTVPANHHSTSSNSNGQVPPPGESNAEWLEYGCV